MVLPSRSDELADLLTAADVLLEATRAAVRLATARAVPTRMYTLDRHVVLELDSERTLVFDPQRHEMAIFPSVQVAVERHAPAQLVFRQLLPALAARQTPASLSAIEKKYLCMLARGATNKEIGQRLHVAESTVKNRLSQLFERFGVHSRAEMVAASAALGLLQDSDAVFDTLAAA